MKRAPEQTCLGKQFLANQSIVVGGPLSDFPQRGPRTVYFHIFLSATHNTLLHHLCLWLGLHVNIRVRGCENTPFLLLLAIFVR